MGILHFAGLGKSPGAVTTGLSFLRNKYGIHSDEYGDTVEAVVVFTSAEIASGEVTAFPVEHNEYNRRATRKTWPAGKANALEIVREFVHLEFPKAQVYRVIVDVNDFNKCLEAMALTLHKFHASGKVGKHIWGNLTGGTNVWNAALMQAAYFSGFIPRLYYTFVADIRKDGKYLQPFSADDDEFDFREVFVLYTAFDERYQYVLEALAQQGEAWISSGELLARLKGHHQDWQVQNAFVDVARPEFIRDFLNVMPGVQRQGNRAEGQQDANRLSPEGQELLNLLSKPWFKALLRREQLPDDSGDETMDLDIQKISE